VKKAVTGDATHAEHLSKTSVSRARSFTLKPSCGCGWIGDLLPMFSNWAAVMNLNWVAVSSKLMDVSESASPIWLPIQLKTPIRNRERRAPLTVTMNSMAALLRGGSAWHWRSADRTALMSVPVARNTRA
jgi:hypothetical protein